MGPRETEEPGIAPNRKRPGVSGTWPECWGRDRLSSWEGNSSFNGKRSRMSMEPGGNPGKLGDELRRVEMREQMQQMQQ